MNCIVILLYKKRASLTHFINYFSCCFSNQRKKRNHGKEMFFPRLLHPRPLPGNRYIYMTIDSCEFSHSLCFFAAVVVYGHSILRLGRDVPISADLDVNVAGKILVDADVDVG